MLCSPRKNHLYGRAFYTVYLVLQTLATKTLSPLVKLSLSIQVSYIGILEGLINFQGFIKRQKYLQKILKQCSVTSPHPQYAANAAAAAQSFRLCPTLCNPMDCSLPGSSIHEESPGKNTGVGGHALLQGIFPTQGSNLGLLHCGQILYH